MIKRLADYAVPSLLLAVGVWRLWGLGDVSLWYDEAFTKVVATLPIEQAWQMIKGDVHPPLYYLLMWGWVRGVGSSDALLRLPSWIFSMAALLIGWQLMVAWCWSERAQFVGLLLAAFAPAQTFYAQEARMYAAMECALLAGLWLANDRRRWGAGLAAAALTLLHNYGLFYAGGIVLYYAFNLWWSGRTRKEALYELVECGFIAYGPWLVIWLPVLIMQMFQLSGGYWIDRASLGNVAEVLFWSLYSFGAPEVIVGAANLLGALTVGLAAVGMWRMRPPAEIWVMAGMFALPMVGALAVEMIWRPILLSRAFLPGAMCFLMAVGWLLDAQMAQGRRRAYYALIVIVAVMAAAGSHYRVEHPKESASVKVDGIRRIEAEWQPGDRLFFTSSAGLLAWHAYAPELAAQAYAAPVCGSFEAWGGLSELSLQGLGIRRLDYPALWRGGRVWVVQTIGPLHHGCIERRARGLLMQSSPVVIYNDSFLSQSGVWLYEPGKYGNGLR